MAGGTDHGMFGWYMIVLSKYVEFSGRARRKEFWFFLLMNMLVSFFIGFVVGFMAVVLKEPAIIFSGHIYSLVIFLPSISVLVRRLHDTGRSGWWYWIALVPLVGAIILIIFLAEDSDPGGNQYGPNPKLM